MVRTLCSGILAVAVVGLVSFTASAQGDAEKGKAVYAAQKCSLCHSIAGAGKKTNPLDGVGAKLSAEDTKQWIVDPVAAAAKHKSTKKPVMPPKYGKLPAADVDALVAYMQSLK